MQVDQRVAERAFAFDRRQAAVVSMKIVNFARSARSWEGFAAEVRRTLTEPATSFDCRFCVNVAPLSRHLIMTLTGAVQTPCPFVQSLVASD